MANRELDEQCALALGLTRDKWRSECYANKHSFDDYGYDPTDGTESGWCYTCGVNVNDRVADGHIAPPRFSEDHAAARLLEDEIERRELGYEYIEALIALVNVPDLHLDQWPKFDDVFKIKRATPEQCARAFLKAINA